MENSKRVLFLVLSIRRVQYILNLIRSFFLACNCRYFDGSLSIRRSKKPRVYCVPQICSWGSPLIQSGGVAGATAVSVTSHALCEAERSFSSIRQLKTWLRSSATQKRLNLNNLAVCSTHRDPVDCLDLKKLVNTFTSSNERRLPTVNFLRK